MDCYTDHSAILDYLAQVEQEEQLRESLKNKSGIAALRVERGTGPYKTWEREPLCDDSGDASSSSANDFEDAEKEHGLSRMVSKKTLSYLIWVNCTVFVVVVIGGTCLGSYGNASSGGRMRSEPPGSLIRHNALIGLHQHPIAHLAPAPAPAFNFGPADAPHVALAPAPALAAPGLAPAPAKARKAHGKGSGGLAQRQFDPAVSSAALAAAQYWKEQQAESVQGAARAWDTEDLTRAKPSLAPAPAPAWYWAHWGFGSAPGPQPHVPAPAPMRAHKPATSKKMPSWAHATDYSTQAQQHVPAYSGYSSDPAASQGRATQRMQGYPSGKRQAQAQPGSQSGGFRAGSSSALPAQQGAYTDDWEDVPSQAAMAAQAYGRDRRLPDQATAGGETPINQPAAAYSKWAPFHTVHKPAQPAQAGGATSYLTPSEVQAIGVAKRKADTADLHEDGFLNAHSRPWP